MLYFEFLSPQLLVGAPKTDTDSERPPADLLCHDICFCVGITRVSGFTSSGFISGSFHDFSHTLSSLAQPTTSHFQITASATH